MVRRCGKHAAICALGALLMLLTPAMSFAQDDDDEGLSFGEDEAGGGEGDEGLSFGEDEAAGDEEEGGATSDPLTASNNDTGSVAVVAVNTGAVDDEQRRKLQTELNNAMGLVRGYEIQGESGVLGALNDNGPDCVREAICLASIGGDADVDKLLLARITKVGDTYKLDLDFFDVQERLFINYETVENLGSPNAAIDNVEGAVKRLFKVRDNDGGPEIEDKPRNEWIQPTFAYTSAGLAAACIVGGVVFGNQAKGDYDEVKTQADAGNLTQRQARDQFEAANAKARRANLFYGLGVGMGVLSAVLFTVDLGSDVAEDDEYVRIKDLRIAPAVNAQGGGIGTSFRF